MTDFELAKQIKLAYLKTPILTSKLFNQVIDLILRLMESSGGSGGNMTPEQIRNALQTLIGSNRLNASAIHNLAENVVFINPETNQPTNIIDMVDYLIDLINNSTIQPGPGTGLLFYNDQGQYVPIDWSMIENRITKTSELENDGQDGSSRYIQLNEIDAIVKEKINQDTGILSGFVLTLNSTLLGISSGRFAINNGTVISFLDFDATSFNIDLLNPTKSNAYLAIDINKNIIIKYEEFNETERRLNAVIGYVEYSGTNFTFCKEIRPTFKSTYHQFYDLLEAFGIISLSGNEILTGNDLKLSKSKGSFFGPNINGVDQFNPHKLNSGLLQHFQMKYVYGNIYSTIVNSIDLVTTFKIDNGNLTPLGTNKFGFTKISFGLSQEWYSELSENEYNTLDDAKSGIVDFISSISSFPKTLFQFFIIYQNGITNLNLAISQNLAEIVNTDGLSIASNLTYQKVVDALGYVPENVTNKVEDLNNPNHTTYPTTKAVSDAIVYAIDNQPLGSETHNFLATNNVVINYQISSPVKAFVYVNGNEAFPTISYDQINKIVNVKMGRPFTGYVIVESLKA